MSTNTAVNMELMAAGPREDYNKKLQSTTEAPQTTGHDNDIELGPAEHGAPANPVASVQQRWNHPKINFWRFLSCLLSFLVMGMNDAVNGALIPYLEIYYGASYTIVSLIFLAPFAGYVCAASLNNTMHNRLGQRGIAIIAPMLKIVTYVVLCNHPPFPVLPIAMMIAGAANGLEDAAWNAWVGNMANANELLGILHGLYGLGGTIAPLIATAMITKANLQWYTFYYIMIGISVVEFGSCALAFWEANAARYLASLSNDSETKANIFREALTNRITWTCAMFLLAYVGLEVAVGGWLVTFMLRVRDGAAFASGMVVTGFWLGLTLGRVTLGFVTARIGEKRAIAVYLITCVALELLFWLIPSFLSSAICSGFLGFFLGPLFPAAIVAATKLLPSYLHVSAIGFASAFGGGGAALFPFIVGAIAQSKGVQVLQPIALALLAAIFLLWCSLPGGFKKNGLEKAQVARAEGTYKHHGWSWLRDYLNQDTPAGGRNDSC